MSSKKTKQTDDQFNAMVMLARAFGAYKREREYGTAVSKLDATNELRRARDYAERLGCDVGRYSQEEVDKLPPPVADGEAEKELCMSNPSTVEKPLKSLSAPGVFHAFIPGKPEPQGSAKGFPVKRAGGRIGIAITTDNDDLKAWRGWAVKVLKAEALAHKFQRISLPFTGASSVRAEFVFARLKSHPKTDKGAPVGAHCTKPDLDKLQRALGDALESAGIVEQDSRICRWIASKRYALLGEDPGVRLSVTAPATNIATGFAEIGAAI